MTRRVLRRIRLLALLCLLCPRLCRGDEFSPRSVIDLDLDWHFIQGDLPGARAPDFDAKMKDKPATTQL